MMENMERMMTLANEDFEYIKKRTIKDFPDLGKLFDNDAVAALLLCLFQTGVYDGYFMGLRDKCGIEQAVRVGVDENGFEKFMESMGR